MLIHNYGLFWKREDVHWGAGRNPGHLLGIHARAKRDGPVDFRRQQGIYCLYDDAFQLVYVGQAGIRQNQRLFGRLRAHTRDHLSDRWTRFSWFGTRAVLGSGKLKAEKNMAHPKTGIILDHIEAILIVAAEPPHNRQGGRFGKGVDRYLQYRDAESLGPTVEEMVRNIWDATERNLRA